MFFPLHPDAQARLDMLSNVPSSETDDVSSEPDPSGRRGELASAASLATQAKPAMTR